ncbi:hypothetical protein TDB9533_03565 [Thalassocella blandensis]|nr:hypothetical protein TDB9533_03565 [Thalassocella blandensis]
MTDTKNLKEKDELLSKEAFRTLEKSLDDKYQKDVGLIEEKLKLIGKKIEIGENNLKEKVVDDSDEADANKIVKELQELREKLAALKGAKHDREKLYVTKKSEFKEALSEFRWSQVIDTIDSRNRDLVKADKLLDQLADCVLTIFSKERSAYQNLPMSPKERRQYSHMIGHMREGEITLRAFMQRFADKIGASQSIVECRQLWGYRGGEDLADILGRDKYVYLDVKNLHETELGETNGE